MSGRPSLANTVRLFRPPAPVPHLPWPGEQPDPGVEDLLDALWMGPLPLATCDPDALAACERRGWAARIGGGPFARTDRTLVRITRHGCSAVRIFQQQIRMPDTTSLEDTR